MNNDQQQGCGSPEPVAYLRSDLLPVVAPALDFDGDVIGIGPQPRAAPGRLWRRARRLAVIGPGPAPLPALPHKFRGAVVAVDDAAAVSLADGPFDAAAAFTVLHHVPAGALPLALAEVLRALRPGGALGVPAGAELRFTAGKPPAGPNGEAPGPGLSPVVARAGR